MLNELFVLSKILNDSNIEQKDWHKSLKTLPQNNMCFRAWISKDGHIKDIDRLSKEQIHFLRKYEPSNGHSVPAFNCPSLWIFNKKDKKDNESKEADILASWAQENNDEFSIDTFKEWITKCKQQEFFDGNKKLKKDNENYVTYVGKTTHKLRKCTKDIPEQLKSYIPVNIENAVSKLLEILLNDNFDFQRELTTFILRRLESKENYKIVLEFLLQESASIVLDYKEWQELDDKFRYPIVHEKSMDFLNEILQEKQGDGVPKSVCTSKKQDDTARADAFGDKSDIDIEKLPNPTLPQLGKVILRSMTRESPCHIRYGKIESDSYPISKNNVANIKKAIEWLSDKERKGKTWTVAGSKELLFAYPSKLCDDVKIVEMLGGIDDEDGDDSSALTAAFEKKAEEVTKALTKLATDGETINIELFALKSIDDGHKNISYYRNYDAQKLINAADDWKNGCQNIPTMGFDVKTPFPLDVAKISNKLYKMDGTENSGGKKLKPINSYQGLNLMLEKNTAELARYILGILQMNCRALVIHLGGAIWTKSKKVKPIKNQAYIFPLFGLLLHKLNVKKEHYMENFPYLLGRMLKISDGLHALWCDIVRGEGNLPPQLAGNSLFASALETPISSLAQLGQRVDPYLKWAKQYRTKKMDKSGLAAWYLKLYEECADKINVVLPSKNGTTFNDVEKSQLFIGYLASFPKKEEEDAK